MGDSNFIKIDMDLSEGMKALLKRNEELQAENKRLKEELAEEKKTSDNYWKHIVWQRTPEEMKPKAKPCSFCKSEHVGLDGSVCDRAFFVWCDDCGAMGPEAGSEAEAISAWNKAGAGDRELEEE